MHWHPPKKGCCYCKHLIQKLNRVSCCSKFIFMHRGKPSFILKVRVLFISIHFKSGSCVICFRHGNRYYLSIFPKPVTTFFPVKNFKLNVKTFPILNYPFPPFYNSFYNSTELIFIYSIRYVNLKDIVWHF